MAFGGRSQLKMSEETFDFVCTSCAQNDKTVEAVKYCVECSGYCCQTCVDTHKMFPALKNHNVIEVSQGNVHVSSGQPTSLLEIPTERCSEHKGKVMDMYCEGHDVVGCSTCFFKDHKFCQESYIHSIPDMIDTIYKLSDCKQTHSLLKERMVSMATVSKSKDTQLQTLIKAKTEAIDKVNTFEKALEAILRKIAEASRLEVEDVYKQLEGDILQEKHVVNNIRDDLKQTDGKLIASEGNRAQHFVATKIAQGKIEESGVEKMKQELHLDVGDKIAFIPDHSLIEYMKVLQGIGKVQKHGKQKQDLYEIKGSRDICIKLSDDSYSCRSRGCCLTQDDQLLVTDYSNKKLKRIDVQNMSIVDYCTLDYKPVGVSCISKHEVAIACEYGKKIQFVSIRDKMTPTRHIETKHYCYGIAFNDGKLYVTDDGDSLYVYDLAGTLLKTISEDNAGNKLLNDGGVI